MKRNTLLIIISIIILIVYLSIDRRKKLRNEGILDYGIITGYKMIRGTNIKYIFHRKEYVFPTSLGADKILLLKNKKIPVIFLKTDEKENSLLLFSQDFEKYNLKYPDSLKWICKTLKLDNCKEPKRWDP